MVDQLVIDSQNKLKQFAEAWEKRSKEFWECGMKGESIQAKLLATLARAKAKSQNRLLEEDIRLDKKYDLLKEKKAVKV